MSIRLEDIYEETRHQYQLELVAGRSGLSNTMTWIYMAEDIGNARFLHGGELIISTGFASAGDPNWLMPFIKSLIYAGTSGLILNIGNYLQRSDISEDIIQLCDESHFPLMTMPWEIHISNISQDYCNRIFADRQNAYDLASGFHAILRDNLISAHTAEMLNDQGYLPNDRYCLAVMTYATDDDIISTPISQLRRAASFCASSRNLDYLTLSYHKHLLLIWHNTRDADIAAHVEEWYQTCTTFSFVTEIQIGISQNIPNILNLSRLYRQALAAAVMAKDKTRGWNHYDNLGYYQLFFSITDTENMRQYYRQYLSVLEDYDAKHESIYIDTLANYLRYDGHIGQIAQAMICHKNTISYRINKIRDMLGMDLNDGDTKFQLNLAIHIREYLKISES